MGRTWFYLAFSLAAGAAHAADLATAQKQWENKQFNEAFRNFKTLAEQGVPAAQLQLGEMYGFGEGTAEDAAQAEAWLNKAIAAGQPEAQDSLALVRARAKHKNDIAAYTRDFTGEQLAYGKYGCVRPAIPEVSKRNKDVVATNEAINKWRACYGTFAERLNGALPVTNTIPPDIVKLMNNEEFQQASKLIETTYARLAGDGQLVADQVALESKAWAEKTAEYAGKTKAEQDIFLSEQNRIMRDIQSQRDPGGKKK